MPVYDVTLSPYSADPTGVADATAAIQAAVDDAQDGTGGTVPLGGIVYVPAGNYLMNGALSGNYYNGVEMRVGISIPEIAGGADANPQPGSMQFLCEGKSTRFIYGNDNMIMIHNSTMYTDLGDFTLVGDTVMDAVNNDWTKNQIGVSFSPPDFQDFSSNFNLSWNTGRNIAMHNLRIGLHIMSGGVFGSDIYRSRFTNFTMREVGVGLYLQSNPNKSITMTAVATDDFTEGDEIQGGTSNALATINKITGSSPTYTFFYQLHDINTNFTTAAETIINNSATGSATKNASAPAKGNPPGNNRHTFNSFDINTSHIGVLDETGDTNSFQHLEVNNTQVLGPPVSLVPDGIPTAIYMEATDPNNSELSNVGNIFQNLPFELNHRNVYLNGDVRRNDFYGIATGGTVRTDYSAAGGESIGDTTIVVGTSITADATGVIRIVDVSDSNQVYTLRYSSQTGVTWTLANVNVASADAGTNMTTVVESGAFGSVQYGDLVLNKTRSNAVSYVTAIPDSNTINIWPPIIGQTSTDAIEINAVPIAIDAADLIRYSDRPRMPFFDDVWPDNNNSWNTIIGGGAFVIPSKDDFFITTNHWSSKSLPAGNMALDYDTDELLVKLADGTFGVLATGVAASGPSKLDQYTTAARDLLSPDIGWIIWNTTTVQYEVYTGVTNGWVKVLIIDGNQECS